MIKRKAFTLVEILVAMVIFSIILAGVYKLFIGGSRTANKGQWINGTVEQMRNALSFLNKEINNATYPTTMLKDKIYDPCDNQDEGVAKKYYLKILKDSDKIKTPSNNEIKIMSWQVCTTEKLDEKQDNRGKLTEYELYLSYKNNLGSTNTGNLICKIKAYDYTTNKGDNYAKSGKLNLSPISSETRNKTLVEDVEWVEFSALNFPSTKNGKKKHLDFSPISIKIHTLYPKDLNVFKENSITATPKVAIDLL